MKSCVPTSPRGPPCCEVADKDLRFGTIASRPAECVYESESEAIRLVNGLRSLLDLRSLLTSSGGGLSTNHMHIIITTHLHNTRDCRHVSCLCVPVRHIVTVVDVIFAISVNPYMETVKDTW